MSKKADVRLIITSPDEIRESIRKQIKEAVALKFPIEGTKYVATADNLFFKEVEFPHKKQRDILLAKGNASDALYGDITIKDKATGEAIQTLKKHRIMNLPYFTNRYTLLLDGNEYSIVNQMRTKPGVYTRKRGNDDIEASFNLSKGANFRVSMDPSTGIFKISILGSTLYAAALLKILGAAPQDISASIGEELYKRNNGVVTDSQLARARKVLYEKATRSAPDERLTPTELDAEIRSYFANTALDSETTKLTLGTGFSSVNAQALLSSMAKILRVFNEEDDMDERDNLEFQKIFSVEDILREVMTKNSDITTKIRTKLNNFKPSGDKDTDIRELKTIISPVYFSKPIRSFVTTSSISRLPQQINPVEIMDAAAIVTRLGEGAISSETAVPDETRQVNYSYLGAIDPISAPESSKVGIDNRVTISAFKGTDNEFYKSVRNMKTGDVEIVRAIDLYDKYVGFADPKDEKPSNVAAVYEGKLVNVPRGTLDYQFTSNTDMLTHTTASIPFINAIQGNRAVMGAKHVQQALPLKDPDKRLVATVLKHDNTTGASLESKSVDLLGGFMLPKAPVDGVISKIDESFIYIKGADGTVHKKDYVTNMPLATKTLLHNTLRVQEGDKVKAGAVLADSNFTKDGELTMGRNLRVAYMPYYGMNHEDGIVISEDAAKKLTSVHSDKVTLSISKLTVLDLAKFTKHFPTTFTTEQLKNIDERGIVKEGTILKEGDPIIVAMEDDSSSRRNQVLGLLHKSFVMPYRDISEIYSMAYPAEVLGVKATASIVTVMLRIEKPMQVGDKLSGSYGNKGVVTRIQATDRMPRDKDGNPMEVLLAPIGVVGRINPAQILETSLGKVAIKSGKRYEVENFGHKDYTDFVLDEMAKHNVEDKEDLFDPETGKHLGKVFTGYQHMHKLFKTTDTNFAARGIEGAHDADESPTGSGVEGPKAVGGMEVNMLLAHNARNILKESTMLRSSKNTDFWRAYQMGNIPKFPNEKKTFTRFAAILRQAGIKLDRQGDNLSMSPLTDKDILKESAGEIKNALVLSAKDLTPETDGLFDQRVTGGLTGDRWSHITLVEPALNPVFENAAKSILQLSTKDMKDLVVNKGGGYIKEQLNSVNVQKEIEKLEKDLAGDSSLSGALLDNAVKRLKYLKALDSLGMKPGDAYVLSVVPVLPPVMRPITISSTGDMSMSNDANTLYKDLILQNKSFESVKEQGIEELLPEVREGLYANLKELTGVVAPNSPHLRNRGIKGALSFIAGDEPKHGYFQRKVIYGKMNLSGRATIVPDQHLDLDEIGLPETAAWSLYRPFIVRDLVQRGYSAIDAREEITNHSEVARSSLLTQMEKRPVLFNRAPTLHRHNIVALKPVLRDSKNFHINSTIEKGMNADYDGDACTVHLPVTDEALEEAWSMLPSKMVFSDVKRRDVVPIPTNEPIVGLYKATANLGKPKPASVPVRKFMNVEEAWQAYYKGNLKMTDYVAIG